MDYEESYKFLTFWFGGLLLIVSIAGAVGLLELNTEFPLIQEIEDRNCIDDQRCVMYYDNNIYRSSAVNGLYYPQDDYYVVWVGDREISEIEETDKHEYCHHLVAEKYYHFCQEEAK